MPQSKGRARKPNNTETTKPIQGRSTPSRVSQVRSPSSSRSQSPVVIVAIGASAGGLQAIEQFLDHLPADCRIAVLIVVHRSIDQPTLLSQVLRSHTPMPVADAV